VAETAPHESCPITTTSGTLRTPTPYSTEASTPLSTTWPAVRMTNSSPRPRSKTNSAATLLSEQPKMSANGD
jgi:hypothetical protein